MDEKELQELQDPESWDFDNAETHPGFEGGRSAVVVPFQRDEFQRVSSAAARAGKKTTDFIREAALQQAHRLHDTAASTSKAATTNPRPG